MLKYIKKKTKYTEPLLSGSEFSLKSHYIIIIKMYLHYCVDTNISIQISASLT